MWLIVGSKAEEHPETEVCPTQVFSMYIIFSFYPRFLASISVTFNRHGRILPHFIWSAMGNLGRVPPNLSFEIDDIEEPWTFTKKFDFIHSRMMVGSLASWETLLGQGLRYSSFPSSASKIF